MVQSAFGVDHGAISKRQRDTGAGAKYGAQIGAGVGAANSIVRTPGMLRTLKTAGHSGGVRGAAAAGGIALGTAFHGGLGAGIGAAVGRKKKVV